MDGVRAKLTPVMRRLPLLLSLLLPACSSSSAPPAKDTTPPKKSAEADAPAEDAKADAPAPTDDVAPTATAEVGKPAPDFTLTDLDGKAHTLSAYAGKIVVLEWFNPGCPFVNYAHSEGPLVDMAKKETAQGVVWLSINSGAPGKQGHGAEANEQGAQTFGMTNPILLDDSGDVGRMYDAKKTPHLFVIDAQGVLRYAGGLDNAPMGEVDGDDPVRAYVSEALADVRAGKDVRVPTSPPWGCTVKYAS